MYKQSHNRIQPQSKPEVNIYQELSQLPTKIADKITNAKTGGGRSLNAIHASKTLSQLEKHLLLVLGSQMNFCQEFANQYRYISLNDLAEKLSVNQRTVSGILNGMKRKTGYVPGLIEKGYVKKLIPTKPEQLEKHWKTDYCITSKIFDEYLILCIEREKALIAEEERKRGSEKPLPSDLGSEDPLIL
ncbi:MAG TPA: hypothetical protein VN698_14865, partial [Bacteroidia bacterium]|nr:hypothetical protein [Bacteroidia bacterium]